jgi:ElaA protein
VTVRVVSFEDLDARTAYALWQLRQQVFVIEQDCPYPDLDGRDLEPGARHFLLEEDGELVGALRLLDDGDAWRIGRVVVAPAARGRGLADELMREAMARVGDRLARLDAQTGLARWYAGYGFAVSGPEFVEDGIPHLPMERTAGQPAGRSE